MSNNWKRPEQEMPAPRQLVDWIAPSGDQVNGGTCVGRLWFLPGAEMYVYYQPTHWRPSTSKETP